MSISFSFDEKNISVVLDETNLQISNLEQNVQLNLENQFKIEDLSDKTLVKILMLKGEKGDAGATTGASWGYITGNITDQTDLKNALNSKANKNELSTVATSGSYTDLSNKPTIPSKTSDLTNDSGFIDNSYHDNTKQDTLVSGTNIKTINNTSLLGSGNITIEGGGGTATDVQINGTSITSSNIANIVTEGTYNASTNKIATKSDIPTKTSDLTNDSGFITSYTETDPVFTSSVAHGITSTDITNWNNKSTFSGNYNDLTNKPTIPDELSDLSDDSTHRLVTDTEKSTWNAKSDFSGSYNDLTDKPTIPTVGNSKIYYGTCSTAKSTTDKVVVCPNFVLETGATISILFEYEAANSADMTLNVNNTGAKKAYRTKNLISTPLWSAGEVVSFTYDGDNRWIMHKGDTASTSRYGLVRLSNSVTSTSPSDGATSKAVKTAYDLADGKQDALVSGTNIKTINSTSLLGSGDITVSTFSGSYNDLTDKPTIPTVNDATLTIQKNSTTIDTFSANASSNKTINITVPTNNNELTNGAGYITGITSSDVTTALGYTPEEEITVLNDTDLTNINSTSDTTFIKLKDLIDNNKPFCVYSEDYVVSSSTTTNWYGTAFDTYKRSDGNTTTYSFCYYNHDTSGGAVFEYRFEVSGTSVITTIIGHPKQDEITSTNKLDYSLIDNTPTIPTKVSDLTNDSGFITSYTETDPIFSASASAGITSTDINNWNSKPTPADYVIQTGTETVSSITWTYTKWNSGKIELFGSNQNTGLRLTTASAGTYYGAGNDGVRSVTLPFTFDTILFVGYREISSRASGVYIYEASVSGSTLTTQFRAHASSNNVSCGGMYHIIGTITQ